MIRIALVALLIIIAAFLIVRKRAKKVPAYSKTFDNRIVFAQREADDKADFVTIDLTKE